jgi:hypothetical protein
MSRIPENVQDREISEEKNQTSVRGQDGKISDTQGKDFLIFSVFVKKAPVLSFH